MVIESEKNTNRPYPPPSNVISVLERLRSRNLPEKIDEEFLRDAGVPEGTIGRSLFALRFLNLINEASEPSDAVKAIHTSTDEEYQSILSGLIREAYKEVFNIVDPTQDSQDKILNVFRRYTPASQRDRMVVFFLGMCRNAGISTLDVPKARTMSDKPSRTKAPAFIKIGTRVEKVHTSESKINPAIDGLIKSLPEPDQPLSNEKLDQWLEMAKATLRFIYPLSSTKQVEKADGSDSTSSN